MTNEKIISGGKWTLVWENLNLDSDFSAQTIQLDLSKKKEVLVKFVYANNYTYPICEVGGSQVVIYFGNMNSATTAIAIHRRDIEADSNGVTFSDCYRKLTTSTAAATTTGAYMKPTAIYAR